MHVILVFRDSRKQGKSIEGIFKGLVAYSTPEISITVWEYNRDLSVITNLRSLRQLKGDIIHITGDITYLAIFLQRKKVILTIHDIGLYKVIHGFKKWVFRKIWIQWPLRIAKSVTVVSAFTRNDLLQLVPKMHGKIQVIPNGIHPGFKPMPRMFNTSQPRILQVGTAPHKNLDTVIRAVKGMNCVLVIIGSLDPKTVDALAKSGVAYEQYADLDIAALKTEYEKCDLLVFVSLHEGFGMPVIEAQAVGRPVITSRRASIPEVAGNGAFFLENPLDEKELTSAIHRVVNDVAFRETLVAEGFKNAQQYTFSRMANTYLELYAQLGTK